VEVVEASATFLKSSRKCLAKMAVAAKRVAKSRPRDKTSCLISKWNSWRPLRDQAKLSLTVGRTFVPLAREIKLNLELHPLLAVAVVVRVSKIFAKVLS
jgi:hypothetical protein